MMPAYNESYTHYSTKNGNTQLYIYRRRPYKKLSARKKYIITQKLLGIGLVAVGIVAMIMFPEDACGGFVASGMGLLRVVYND